MRWLIIILLFQGCSADWHYQKACQKDSTYCATSFQIDTVLVTDSFYTHRVDTLNKIDTITIDTGGVYYRIIRSYDTFKTTLIVKSDTIKVTMVKTIKPKIVHKTPLRIYILLVILFLLLLWRILIK